MEILWVQIPTNEGPRAHVIRNALMRGALASLRSSVMAPLCWPWLTVREVVTELHLLEYMRVMGPKAIEATVLKCQKPGNYITLITSNVRQATEGALLTQSYRRC